MLIIMLILILCEQGLSAPFSYDVAWTFGNVDSVSYRLDSVEPADTDLGATLGTDNPSLRLQLGLRYQVTVTNYQTHPLEILAKGPSASSDIVLLAIGPAAGLFEFDPDVAWQDDNAGTVAFTLTYTLYRAMSSSGQVPGYRCSIHTTTMRGNFLVQDVPTVEAIPTGQISIELDQIASGLTSPLALQEAPDETGRLFVTDQAGKVRLIVNGILQDAPFLDVTDRLVTLGISGVRNENDYDERGFLGFAFHPGFSDPNSPGYRKVYTYTSEPVSGPADFTTDPVISKYNNQSVISEWTVDANDINSVDAASRREILRINEPQFNHDGGTIAFDPNQYTYISLGDGGGANDTSPGHGPTGNGQNINTIYGSIVRIDPLEPSATLDSNDLVSANGQYRIPLDNPFVGKDGLDEIYAYGFRNPFKYSFDPNTSRLIVADVGQGNIEEIDIVKNGGNYGWNIKEGTFRFDPITSGISNDLTGISPTLIDPVTEYDHNNGLAVVGGFVYRGTAIPELRGKYVFGDFSHSFGEPLGQLFYTDLTTGLIQKFIIGIDDRSLGLYVKGFGVDSEGEIYVLASTALGPYGTGGYVLKIVPIE